VPFGLILAFAIPGMIALRHKGKTPVIIYATFFGTVATMLLFYVTTRYRMSLAPVAILLAGVGVDHIIENRGDRKQVLRSASIALAVFVLSLPPFLPIEKRDLDRARATSWANLSVVFYLGDRIPEAAQAISTATRLAPEAGTFQMMYYDFALRPSFPNAALEFEGAQKLIQAFPTHPGGYRRSGDALMKLARPQQALGQYEIALQRGPADTQTLLGLARALDAIGRSADATGVLQQLLSIAPEHEEAREFLARLRS
jgi:tetratricopeptide (TPR) repeat protein